MSGASSAFREPDPLLNAQHLDLLLRSAALLALTADSYTACANSLRLVVHFAQRLIVTSLQLAMKKNRRELVLPADFVLTLPNTLLDWLRFEPPSVLVNAFETVALVIISL